MKNLLLVLLMVAAGITLNAQVEYVTFGQVKQIADQNAQSMWGEIYPSGHLAIYSNKDELIGYRFTYSINQPFPEKTALFQTCREAHELGDSRLQWGIDNYGTIFVSARKDIGVIRDFTKALPPHLANGFLLEDIARENLGENISMKKAYYIDFQNQWFCYTNGNEDIYINIFPKVMAVNKTEFLKLVGELPFFSSPGSFDAEWDQFLNQGLQTGKSEIWIPLHDGNCKFYDWSYGCSPTAAAMLLSYWDYVSLHYSFKYTKLIDYHYQRWEAMESQWDYQVPNVQKQLAIAMNTDTVSTGGTDRTDIAPGYASVCNTTNGYSFTCTHHDHGTDYVWYFNKIVSEIGSYQRPVHISIPGHSECCVAYDAATNLIGVHNTWWGSVQWINRDNLERVYTIVPGGSTGLAIELTHPAGDLGYNHNGSGELFYAGDVYEIRWERTYSTDSYVKLYYSVNGGYNWTSITSNTPNDGKYDWSVPTGISSSSCRILIYVYSSSGVFSGADGSFGNFRINSGGNLLTLTDDYALNTTTEPDYFKFTSTASYWNVVGTRANSSSDDWDIQLHGSSAFNDILASSTYGVSSVDFVVLDGNHTASSVRGIKAVRYSGTGTAKVEFEGGSETCVVGTPLNLSWPAGDVVEIYDTYLEPGYYGFLLDITSGTADLDIGLYGSDGITYYAGRNAYKAWSGSGGSSADESFNYEITTADWYGLCIWANNGNSANYTLKVETLGTWLGTVSTDWNNSANWSGNTIPTASIDVSIPSGTPHQPYVQNTNGNCKSLLIESGATLTIGGYSLNVTNDVNVEGTLTLNNTLSKLYVNGSIYWYSGSNANALLSATIYVQGTWDFLSGAEVFLNAGYVDFFGTGTSYIRSRDDDSHFYHVRNNKTGDELGHSALSTHPCRINGNLYIYTNCKLTSFTSESFFVGNYINNMNGIIELNDGTVVFNGTGGTSNFMPGDYFNNVIISSSGGTTVFDDNIEIKGNLTINSGTLSPGSTTMTIGGDWSNNVGASGFNEGTGRVIFNGPDHQYIYSNEDFNILEINKGAALRVSNVAHTVTCNQYDWTAGAIDVLAGTFTALDLADNGVYGSFYVNPGGTINLTNSGDGTWVDLHGKLYNFGGTINISGTFCYWPYANGAHVEMSGGVIDIKTCFLTIHNNYTWTHNITGGTIRMAYGFSGNRADFTPTAGIFEFYGPADAAISQTNGCTIHDVVINKSTSKSDETVIFGPIYDERTNELISDGTKDNKISLGTNFTITGDLTVQTGNFDLNSYTCSIADNASIFGNLIMNDALNDFSSYTLYWESGSTADVTNGTFHVSQWQFKEGTTAKLGTGNTTYITQSLYYPTSDQAEFGNLVRGPLSKNLIGDDPGKTYYPVKVMGNYTTKSGASLYYQTEGVDLIVAGNAVIENGASMTFSYGDFLVGGTLDLSGTLFIENGYSAIINGDLNFPSGSWLNLNSGNFACNHDAPAGILQLYGKLTMNDGSVCEFPGRSIGLGNTFIDEITGGTLKIGRTFSAQVAGTFEPSGGTVEFITGNTTHYVHLTNGNYLNNMTLNKPSGSFIIYDDLTLTGDMTIDEGILNSYDKTIQVAGDWMNNAGPYAFSESNSRVIFNGSTVQFCSAEDFYILEINKSAELLYNVAYNDITCQVYDWTSGGLFISPGNFSAADLADNGLFGTFAIYGGVMDIHQDPAHFVDVNGTLITGSGGELNVFGGNSSSYWSWAGDATVFMTGGVIDFKDVGILVYNSPTYSFTENITDGTIRTTGHMSVHNLNFTPSGGTVELYGGTDAGIEMSTGNFHNVLINKTGGDGLKMEPVIERDGKVTEGTRANTVNIISNVLINNDLTVEAGTLNVIEVDVSAGGNVNVNSGGSFVLNNNSHLLMGSGKTLSVNNGGTLSMIGSLGAEAGISRMSSGYYAFNIESGGTIAADYGIFEYMNSDGINLKAGAVVDPANTFNHCTFLNGASGGQLLTINNDQNFGVYYAQFPANSWSGSYNVSKNVNAGYVVFYNFSGAFAGEDYDYDPNDRIEWYLPQLAVDPATRTVNPPAGTTTFDVLSNTNWTVTESVGWLSVTPVSGSYNATLTVTYDQQPSATNRTGIITLSAPDVPDVTATVIQSGVVLTVLPASQSVGAPAGSVTFEVTSNAEWSVSESVSWLSVSPMTGTGNQTLTVNYNQNSSISPRSGQIQISATGITPVAVTVNQAGAGAILTVNPDNRNVNATAGTTTFDITSNTTWTVTESVPWFSVSPMSGSGDNTLDVTYGENATGSTRVGDILVTASGGSPAVTVTVTQVSYPTHLINLSTGWQGLSSYIMPANNAIEDVFDPVSAQFIIAQTMTGVYYPAGPINTIYDWLSQSAYKVKMNAPAGLPVIGNAESNKNLSFNTGWKLLPVICNQLVDVAALFGGVSLTVVKDVAGTGIYWPEYNINTIGSLLPGKAYYFLSEAGFVIFPSNSKNSWNGTYPQPEFPDHPWNKIELSSSTHLIAVRREAAEILQAGDIIGAFSNEDLCFGVAEITDPNIGIALILNADDPLTGITDGFTDQQLISYKLYRPSSGEILDLVPEYDQQLPQTGYFTAEGLSAISKFTLMNTGTNDPANTYIGIYPNPTSGLITITGTGCFRQIALFNALGNQLRTITIEGENTLDVDLSDLPDGVYQMKFTGNGFSIIRRVVKN
ncbi:MAG TPA: BACON domain-containing carbohydrate-binding protein [Bacteroidales bacterium]|nr:BACON domain-containing carbohydrate-binding protein [Bacteroidales bacterium]